MLWSMADLRPETSRACCPPAAHRSQQPVLWPNAKAGTRSPPAGYPTEIEYSQPVIYKHFASMEDLMDAVALEGFGELADGP